MMISRMPTTCPPEYAPSPLMHMLPCQPRNTQLLHEVTAAKALTGVLIDCGDLH